MVDDQGAPIRRLGIELFVVGDDGQLLRDYRRMQFGKTDNAGQVHFDSVGPGRWGLTAPNYNRERKFLDPNENPHAPPPRFTIDAETGPIQLEMVLDRGVDVCTRFDVSGFKYDRRAQSYLTESETDKKIRRVLESNADLCRPLFRGRWEIELQPPRGLLLVGLDINGQVSPGAVATLDVRPGDPTQFVTWRFVAPAKLEGYVRFDGEEAGVSIRADLIEPGPWAAAVEARGGSTTTPVYDGPDRTGYYSMLLPDGLWQIQPVARELESAEPESVELRFSPGDELSQDFLVRVKDGARRNGLQVEVSRPEASGRDTVAGAVVELWPFDPSARKNRPIKRKKVGRYGGLYLRSVEAGEYVIAAAHPDYLEVRKDMPGYVPKKDQLNKVELQLKPAGRLDVVLENFEESTSKGGWVEVSRSANSPVPSEYIVVEPSIQEARRQRRGEIDAAGHGRVTGIRPGRYEVTGGFTESFIEFKIDGSWTRSAEIAFAEQELKEFEGREVPAGIIEASFQCKDGEALPTVGEIGVLPATKRPTEPFATDWMIDPESHVEKLSLEGKRQDFVRYGPLDEDASLIGYRPATFDRWSWVGGTEDISAAEPLAIELGKVMELGTVPIECGPAVRLWLSSADEGELPSLIDTREEESLVVDGQVQPQIGEALPITRVRVEPYDSVVVIRDLREGDIDAVLWLGHPYFLPEYWVGIEAKGKLERGKSMDLTANVAGIGGAVELKLAESAAAWVVATPTNWDESTHSGKKPEAEQPQRPEHWTAEIELKKGWLSNLAAGQWQIALCADASCESSLGVHEVTVSRAETTLLDLRP